MQKSHVTFHVWSFDMRRKKNIFKNFKETYFQKFLTKFCFSLSSQKLRVEIFFAKLFL